MNRDKAPETSASFTACPRSKLFSRAQLLLYDAVDSEVQFLALELEEFFEQTLQPREGVLHHKSPSPLTRALANTNKYPRQTSNQQRRSDRAYGPRHTSTRTTSKWWS